MGESRRAEREEIAALRVGLELGLTHIDTAEMYGDGGAERVVAQAIKGHPRESLFVVSKVLPSNASYAGTIKACEQSLARLGTDHLDVYLLHWWSGQHPIADTMRAMQTLVTRGLTRFVGVSNFAVDEMEQAQAALGDTRLACNQVLYHLAIARSSGISCRIASGSGRRSSATRRWPAAGSCASRSSRSPGGTAARPGRWR